MTRSPDSFSALKGLSLQIVLDAGGIGHAAFGRRTAAQSAAPQVAMLRAAFTSACSAEP